VLSSATLEKGMEIVINAMGIDSHVSKRGEQDGYSYFGCKKNVKKSRTDLNSEHTTQV